MGQCHEICYLYFFAEKTHPIVGSRSAAGGGATAAVAIRTW